jgi:hypothetical protein
LATESDDIPQQKGVSMKKIIFIAMMSALGSAQAFDIGANYSRDYGKKVDVTGVTIGQQLSQLYGVEASLDYGRASGNAYKVYGANLEKDYTVGPVAVGPVVGLQHIKSNESAIKSGNVGVVGVNGNLNLTKNLGINVGYGHRFDLVKSENLSGNLASVGVKVTF